MPLDASGSPRAHRPPPCSQGLAGRALEIGCFVRPPRLLGRWRLGQPCQSQDAAWWKGCGCTCEAGLPVPRASSEEAEVEKEKKGLAPHGPMGLCRFLLRQPWCEDTAYCPHWVSLAHHRGGSQWTAHRTPGKGSPWSGSSVLGTQASDGVEGAQWEWVCLPVSSNEGPYVSTFQGAQGGSRGMRVTPSPSPICGRTLCRRRAQGKVSSCLCTCGCISSDPYLPSLRSPLGGGVAATRRPQARVSIAGLCTRGSFFLEFLPW